MSYDLRPGETVKEKDKLLKKMYGEEWILFFEHDPTHQSCTVQFDGKHYRLKESINISE